MLTVEFIPSICKSEKTDKKSKPALWSGNIIVRQMNYIERIEFNQKCGIKIDSKGEITLPDDVLDLVKNRTSEAIKYIESIDLHGPDGDDIKSVEDLMYHHMAADILPELGQFIQQGVRPTKKPKT
jgi:hypothetical protein